jgi:hypothetical protein
MPRRRPLLVVIATAAAALGPAAAAPATTLSTPEACVRYVPGEQTFPVVAQGFTPNTVVRLTAQDGRLLGSGVADAAGNLTTTLLGPAPEGQRLEQTFQVTATDLAGVAAPPIAVPVVRFTVQIPRRARPSSRVRFRALGFPSGQPVFLHVRRGGRTLDSFSLGAAAGPCGIAQRRLRYMPLRRYRTGAYDYVFAGSPRYEASARPSIRLRVLITRTLRRR